MYENLKEKNSQKQQQQKHYTVLEFHRNLNRFFNQNHSVYSRPQQTKLPDVAQCSGGHPT